MSESLLKYGWVEEFDVDFEAVGFAIVRLSKYVLNLSLVMQNESLFHIIDVNVGDYLNNPT